MLLFFDSFDHYQSAGIEQKYTGSAPAGAEGTLGTIAILPNEGRCGTQCLSSTPSPGAGGVTLGLPASGPEFIFGVAIKRLVGGYGILHLGTLYMGGTPILRLMVASNGSIVGITNPDAAFTTTAWISDGGLIPFGIWTHVGFKTVLDGTSGSVDIEINGIPAWSTSGIATVFSLDGTSWNGFNLGGGNFSQTTRYDDFYISNGEGAAPWNDLLGDVHVEYLRPIAPGSQTEWDLVGAASANWEAVDDDAAPDTTTGVSTDQFGEIDTYDYENLALIAGTEVFGVQLSALCSKDEPGDRGIEPVTRNGGVSESGILLDVPLDVYQYRVGTMQANPATGTQWTVAEVNDQEHGFKLEV